MYRSYILYRLGYALICTGWYLHVITLSWRLWWTRDANPDSKPPAVVPLHGYPLFDSMRIMIHCLVVLFPFIGGFHFFFHDVSGNSNDIWLLSPFFSIHFWYFPPLGKPRSCCCDSHGYKSWMWADVPGLFKIVLKTWLFFWKLTSTWTVFWYVLVYFNWIVFFWGNGWSRWSRCRTILLEGGDLTPKALTSACSLTQLQSLSLDGMAALEESFLRIGCCVIRHSCKLWFMISPQKSYYE